MKCFLFYQKGEDLIITEEGLSIKHILLSFLIAFKNGFYIYPIIFIISIISAKFILTQALLYLFTLIFKDELESFEMWIRGYKLTQNFYSSSLVSAETHFYKQ